MHIKVHFQLPGSTQKERAMVGTSGLGLISRSNFYPSSQPARQHGQLRDAGRDSTSGAGDCAGSGRGAAEPGSGGDV
jgi:hypothetical protein